jgi:hypothetical protein
MSDHHSHSCNRSSRLPETACGLFFLLAGALLLLDSFDVVWLRSAWDVWPAGLIAIGLAGLLERQPRQAGRAGAAK